jgi:hypothetical protein
MAVPSLFPNLMKGGTGIGVSVNMPPEGVALTTPIIGISINDQARIINLPADLSVSLGGIGVAVSVSGSPTVTLSTQSLNVEVCTDE